MPLVVYGYARQGEARQELDAAGSRGCADEKLELISHEGVSAIVGGAAAAPEARMDVLNAFQSCVESLHRAMALVPARFGAVDDPEEVRRFLLARDAHLRAVLDQVDGCDEWSLRVRLEPVAAAATTPEPAGGTAGAAYLRTRKTAFELADGVPARLVELCRDGFGPMVALARATRLEGPGKAVLMPGVHLLVPRERRDKLEKAFADVARNTPEKVMLTGPWPAYSFVTAAV